VEEESGLTPSEARAVHQYITVILPSLGVSIIVWYILYTRFDDIADAINLCKMIDLVRFK
jgi:hypothetical protein